MATKNSSKKFAVVTGASTGIGFELARQFADEGYDLLIVAENAEINHAAKLLGAGGAHVIPVQADLAEPEGVENLYRAIKHEGRAIDAAAINAGIGVHGAFIETSWKDELDMINLNAVSAVHLTKMIANDMVRQGEGKILITCSQVSVMPQPFMAVYAATKAFLFVFAHSIRNELKDHNVSVTALLPGATDTEFFARADMEEDTAVGSSKKDSPELVARQGFEALMKGEAHVAGGSMMNKFMTGIADMMPETVKAAIGRKETEPGSAKH